MTRCEVEMLKLKDLKKNKDFLLIRRVFKYLRPYKGRLGLAFVLILGGIGTGLAGPVFWGRILDGLFENNLEGALHNIFYSLVTGILTFILSYFQSYIFSSLNQNIIFDLKKDMYKALLNLPVQAYDLTDSGELMSRLHGDAAEVANTITGTLLNGVVDILRLAATGMAVLAISGRLAMIIAVSFPLSYFIAYKAGKKIRVCNKHLSELNDKYYSNTGGAIWGIREVKSLGIKGEMLASFTRLAVSLKEKLISIQLVGSMAQLMLNSVNTLVQAAITIAGGVLVVSGALHIQFFIACYTYSGQLTGSLSNISRVGLSLQQIMNSLERIFLLVDGLGYPPESFGNKVKADICGNIRFENVSFAYSGGQKVLDKVTLDIPEGRRTALVGSSGSGKTTLFNLLLRFYQPSSGRVLVDGMDLQEMSEEALREHISVVRQEPYLFTMSIRDNLLLANPGATRQQIETACKRAYIHDFIESLPLKYDSLLGENGINLSGGQRQRIAIARALIKKSKIILFDEATSSLDNESQFFISKAINEISGACTVVIIAHRLSTIIQADVIYVMDKGGIAGQGCHSSLINENCVYRKLYRAEVELMDDSSKEEVLKG